MICLIVVVVSFVKIPTSCSIKIVVDVAFVQVSEYWDRLVTTWKSVLAKLFVDLGKVSDFDTWVQRSGAKDILLFLRKFGAFTCWVKSKEFRLC